MAAWRSGGFLAQKFNRRTALEPTTKLSYEALNPPLRQTAVIGWRSRLSWVTTIIMSSVTVICKCFFVWLVCRVFYFFLKRWKFFKNNFSFGLALQAL